MVVECLLCICECVYVELCVVCFVVGWKVEVVCDLVCVGCVECCCDVVGVECDDEFWCVVVCVDDGCICVVFDCECVEWCLCVECGKLCCVVDVG